MLSWGILKHFSVLYSFLKFFGLRNRYLCIHFSHVEFNMFLRCQPHDEIIDDWTPCCLYSVFGFIFSLSVGYQPNFFIQQRNDLVWTSTSYPQNHIFSREWDGVESRRIPHDACSVSYSSIENTTCCGKSIPCSACTSKQNKLFLCQKRSLV